MIQYVALAILAGCGAIKTENLAETGPTAPKDAGSVDDIPSTDSASTDADADITPEIAVAKDSVPDLTVAPPDSFVDAAPDTAIPTDCTSLFPFKGAPKFFAAAPCGAGSYISDIDDTGLGVCSGSAGNKVFQLGKTGVIFEQKLEIMPDQIDQDINGGIAIIGFMSPGNAAGVQRRYGIQGGPSWHPFESITLSGQTFIPKFPKGLQFVSGKLAIAAGDIEFDSENNAKAYSPGVTLVYGPSAVTATPYATKGLNPTSVGAWTQSGITYLAVVNTDYLNMLGDTNGKLSSLTIYDAKTMALQTPAPIPLPFGGLGVAGELAIAGGFMAIPSADNSGRVLLLNTADLQKAGQIITLPFLPGKSGKNMVPFVKIIGHYLVTGGFNTGKIETWDLNTAPATHIGPGITVDEITTDYSGISDAICLGGKFLVAVGSVIREIQ